jgi:hypothetical protein
MSALEIAWSVVGILAPVVVGVGFAVLSMSPAEFRAARVCFVLAALMPGAMALWWTVQGEAPTSRLWIVDGSIGVGIACLLPAGLLWVNKRQRLMSPTKLSATGMPLDLSALGPVETPTPQGKRIFQTLDRQSGHAGISATLDPQSVRELAGAIGDAIHPPGIDRRPTMSGLVESAEDRAVRYYSEKQAMDMFREDGQSDLRREEQNVRRRELELRKAALAEAEKPDVILELDVTRVESLNYDAPVISVFNTGSFAEGCA